MQSQIEYELDVLKSGNYDQALQFIEHLVNILVRMKNALTNNDYVSNRVPQQEDDNFWGYTFNFIAKVVDFELDAMYAVTYRNNQLTLLFNPKEIEDDYTVETMLEGLRHEGYHLLFNHLNVHKNLDNYLSNLAADCEINQHLEQTFGIKALELKYRAIITIPTTIEKTMSPYQLYASNSPLWAVELTARGIERFINWEKYNGKLPKILFGNYYNNAKQGLYFDDNIDMASYYPTIITDLMKGT